MTSPIETFFLFTHHSIILTAQKIMADFTVRDKGYSNYFADLGEDLQNEIIKRTEHTDFNPRKSVSSA